MLRITDTQFDNLSGWRPVNMDMPLEEVRVCPCCLEKLHDIAGIYCGQIVTVGWCTECGYLGYTKRPSAAWFDEFYAKDWDAEGQEVGLVDLSAYSVHPMTQFVSHIVQGQATICDVGCGFGTALWQLKQLGHKVTGIERCAHRIRIANQNGVWTTNSLSLPTIGKFDVITSHHVLEHCSNPDAFIAEIAEHQDEKGLLCLSVPHQKGEPGMGVLLFLCHLHSFTPQSLVKLVSRHGYSLFAHGVCGMNIELAFIKGPELGPSPWSGMFDPVAKLKRTIHANGQGEYLNWCGNRDEAKFCTEEEAEERMQGQWKPRALKAQRVANTGRYPVEVETPCLFVK